MARLPSIILSSLFALVFGINAAQAQTPAAPVPSACEA